MVALFIISCVPKEATPEEEVFEEVVVAGQAIAAGCRQTSVVSCSDAGGAVTITKNVKQGKKTLLKTYTFPDQCQIQGTGSGGRTSGSTASTGNMFALDYRCASSTIFESCKTQCESGEICQGGVCIPLCGNGLPDPGENCASCPADALCSAGYLCQEGSCIPACVPQEEICDGQDNDCDNQVDENFNLQADTQHCGQCGNKCPAGFTCTEGQCGQACSPALEVCDGVDNDCDNVIDGIDVCNGLENCGYFGNACTGYHRVCQQGICLNLMDACGGPDSDQDGLGDACDNCPTITNTGQAGTLMEGESQTNSVSGTNYETILVFIDWDEAKFRVNQEPTPKLKAGQLYRVQDSSWIWVTEILYQDYAGGIHSASFRVGAQKDSDNDGFGDACDSS